MYSMKHLKNKSAEFVQCRVSSEKFLTAMPLDRLTQLAP